MRITKISTNIFIKVSVPVHCTEYRIDLVLGVRRGDVDLLVFWMCSDTDWMENFHTPET